MKAPSSTRGSRSSTARPATRSPRGRAPLLHRGSAPGGSGPFPVASSRCRACLILRRYEPRGAPRHLPTEILRAAGRQRRVTDLLELTAELVDIPSVSHERDRPSPTGSRQRAAARHRGSRLDRVGDNLVARTQLGRQHAPRARRPHRHGARSTATTAPASTATRCGASGRADMKSGLAVMLELARTVAEPVVDVTYVFYAAEEIASQHNGLGQLFDERPDLLAGDIAILGEPTARSSRPAARASMRFEVRLTGVRAHSARPWMGRNAIHRLGALLAIVEACEGREPVIDGCQYREAVQAVHGARRRRRQRRARRGEHRAQPPLRPRPRRSRGRGVASIAARASARRRATMRSSPTRRPRPVPVSTIRCSPALVDRNGLEVRAKLGWTDVARFAEPGHPCRQLRAWRSAAGPHGRRARHPGPTRPDVGGAPRPHHGRGGLTAAYSRLSTVTTRP